MDNTSTLNPIENIINQNNQYLMRGIYNNNSNYNFSYAHAVLQALSCLDCAKQFVYINYLNILGRINQFCYLIAKMFYLMHQRFL